MTMTIDEIIMEYKQAKDPEKQIRIMADQCLCKPSEIRSILRNAGVYQAKMRKPGNQKQPSAPEKAAAQPATPEAPEAPEAPKPADLPPITGWPGSFLGTLEMSDAVPSAPLFTIEEIKASALDAIAEIYPKGVDDGPVEDFAERVRGILILVGKLEEQGGRNG